MLINYYLLGFTMFSLPDITLDQLFLFAIAFLSGALGIILHEVAHGWVASRQGDPTAKLLGRLTLNPVKHIDPMGLFAFVATSILSILSTAGGFIFGWAKPVPVDYRYFSNPRKSMMFVSFAGPLANLLLALIIAGISKIVFETSITPYEDLHITRFILRGLFYGISINVTLALFNLLPIPPLDGSHIIEGLLPENIARSYAKIGRYGFPILLVLLFSGLLYQVLSPLISACIELILSITGLI